MGFARSALGASMFVTVFTMQAAAAPVLTYDIAAAVNPGSVAVASAAGGLSASSITLGPGLFTSSFWNGTAGLFGATGFSVGASPDASDYLQFSVTAGAGKQISYESLTYGLVREIRSTNSNFRAPGNWDLVYSLDGFATAGTLLSTLTVPDSGASNTLNQASFTTDLSAIGTRSGTVSFRWYAYGTDTGTGLYIAGLGNGSGGGLGQDGSRSWRGTGSNVLLNATIADLPAHTVPEPSTLALAALALAAGLAARGARAGTTNPRLLGYA